MTLSSIAVATTPASLKPDAFSRSLNSDSVRSRPPVNAIIVMSPLVPWETSPSGASTLYDQQHASVARYRFTAFLQYGDGASIVPVVDDPLENVGVAAGGDGIEHVAGDQLAPVRDTLGVQDCGAPAITEGWSNRTPVGNGLDFKMAARSKPCPPATSTTPCASRRSHTPPRRPRRAPG